MSNCMNDGDLLWFWKRHTPMSPQDRMINQQLANGTLSWKDDPCLAGPWRSWLTDEQLASAITNYESAAELSPAKMRYLEALRDEAAGRQAKSDKGSTP